MTRARAPHSSQPGALAGMRCAWGLAALVAACSVHASVTATDDAGNVVTLARPAGRIVSLAPHATELLFAAGAGAKVVGVVAHSDWPLDARALPRVGDANALDLERIVAFAPDLVVAWPYTMPAQLAALRARGATIFVSDPKTIAGIARDVEALGTLAGTDATAQPAAVALRARHAALAAKYERAPAISVFYEVWNDPLQTIGGRHLISEAITLCGGASVFGAQTLVAPTVSFEAVVAVAPEAIIAGSDDGRRPGWLDDWKRWRDVPAIRYDNLFVANGDLLHRSGPRFVDGVESLCVMLEQARANRKRIR
jgi:iron complex transport system substrate-binding protein